MGYIKPEGIEKVWEEQWQLRLRKAWLCGGISEFSLETSCKALMVDIDG